VDRLVPGQPGEGARERQPLGVLENLGHEPLHDREEVVAVEERGLDVDLRELGLPVEPEILVPEAAHDLEVALEPRHHQDLLEELGRLGERVEAPPGQPARDQEVAGALRGRAREHRRLDLDEALAVEVVAHGPADLVAEQEVAHHERAAEVEVPVPEPERLHRLLALVERERERLRFVEDLDRLDQHLDLAGREARVDGPLRAPLDQPADGEDELGPDAADRRVGGGVRGRVEDELGDPLAVPEVDEDQAAVIAPAVRPAHEGGRPPGIRRAERPARVAPPPAAGARAGHRSLPNHCGLPSGPSTKPSNPWAASAASWGPRRFVRS
jgi:hypothetical protein